MSPFMEPRNRHCVNESQAVGIYHEPVLSTAHLTTG